MAKDPDLEEKVKELMDSLDKGAEPGVGWTYVSKNATKAAKEYFKTHKGGKEVKEKDLEDETNKRAKTYIQLLGIKATEDDEFYGHMMKQWMGVGTREGNQAFQNFQDAVKRGDELKALYHMQVAYQQNATQAKDSGILTNVENAEPDVQEKLYKKLAKVVGGENADYYEVVKSLQRAYSVLKDKKEKMEVYKKAA
jgi:hypothetical protein